ncbi:hypothetical protein JCM3774_005842 [Rhodotorula dairenensis]
MSAPPSQTVSPQAPDEPAFDGIVFHIHGQWAGWTQRKITRFIEENGGKVSKTIEDPRISHIILSEHLWSRQGTVGADPTIKCILRANAENRTEQDEDYNRVWLLPIEWMIDSVRFGLRLPERPHDLERTQEAKRLERQVELAAERRRNGGASRFARGERQRYERERAMKAEVARLDKLGPTTDDADAFAGIPQLGFSGGLSATPLMFPRLSADAHHPGVPNFAIAPGVPIDPSKGLSVVAPTASPTGATPCAATPAPVTLSVKGAAEDARKSPSAADTPSANHAKEGSEPQGLLAVDETSDEDDLYALPKPKPATSAQAKVPAACKDSRSTASGKAERKDAINKNEAELGKKQQEVRKASTSKAKKANSKTSASTPAKEVKDRKLGEGGASSVKNSSSVEVRKSEKVRSARDTDSAMRVSKSTKDQKDLKDKKLADRGTLGIKKKCTAEVKKSEKIKSARDLALEKVRKTTTTSSAAPTKPVPAAPTSPTGTKPFADFRKPTGGMFAGSSRKVPGGSIHLGSLHLGQKQSSSSPAAAETSGKKRDQAPRRDSKGVTDAGGAESSEDEPLARRAKSLRRSQEDKATGSSSSQQVRRGAAPAGKPAYRIDANGKKRARFIGDDDEGDDDELDKDVPFRTAGRLKKKPRTGESATASKASSAAQMILSDSE